MMMLARCPSSCDLRQIRLGEDQQVFQILELPILALTVEPFDSLVATSFSSPFAGFRPALTFVF